MRPVILVSFLSVLVAGCDGTGPDDEVTLRNRIVFLSDTGRYAIHHMNADGGDDRVVPVELPGVAYSLSVSPDGRSLLAAVIVSGRTDIFRLGADGSGLINLTNNPASDHDPAWSPDGTRIAFTSTRINGTDSDITGSDIFIMNADGSGVEIISEAPGTDAWPAWSPDGTTLAFTSERAQSDNFEIYRGPAEGADFVRVTDEIKDDYAPAWSPLGGQIAFVSTRDSPGGAPRPASIYLMAPDGSHVLAVVADTINYTNAGPPAWSGDGQKLVFSCGFQVFCVVNADGTGRVEIGAGRDPTWGPS